MLQKYLNQIATVASQSDAREESYYAALSDLLLAFAEKTQRRNVHVTTLPKKTEGGCPDFRVWDGFAHVTGYIEAKAPTQEHLDPIETSLQLLRYRETFANVILTNFLEFRLYRQGEKIAQAQIGRPAILNQLRVAPPVEREAELVSLLEKFFAFSTSKITSAEALASELAKRAGFLRDEVVAREFDAEERFHQDSILGFYQAFREFLISNLTREDFADIYAQTVTYGLFAARTRCEKGFNRRLAYDLISPTIGVLKDLFHYISLGPPSRDMEWIVDEIAEILSATDVNSVLLQQNKLFEGLKPRDPIVHFYEPFLAKFDPHKRESRGVYYTPEPVVSYLVRSLHGQLREQFDKADGLAALDITVLDPAAGTGTFLAGAARQAVDEYRSKYGAGGVAKFIREHVLEHFFGFELLMAPYAVGHMKLGLVMGELGYSLRDEDRFKLYLTNTLDQKDLAQTVLPGLASLSQESHAAGEVKKWKPILVILGNPPYSGHSANVSEWTKQEMRAYYQVDGKPLGEKNPKWLQDDYVKFLRFAQWKIDQNGEGVVGFITNHSYLDNPTFRGMRQSLMSSFDDLYFIDLHGNSLKKERCPDGSKDENVFDIRQGVALFIGVKRRSKRKSCQVHHHELWGGRTHKYAWLWDHDLKSTPWRKLKPKSETYLFIPRNERLLKRYQRYPSITDIFPINSVGVVTARDDFVIDFDKSKLTRRIRTFSDHRASEETLSYTYKLRDKVGWILKEARELLRQVPDWQEAILPILYRPFDKRWIFYHDALVERPRKEVMRHMLRDNVGLITIRRSRSPEVWNFAFATNQLISGATAITALDINYLFPLYLYEEKRKSPKRSHGTAFMVMEPPPKYGSRTPNIDSLIFSRCEAAYQQKPSPEQIFAYVYAVLYSNVYREKYAEFLRMDFPRIPFTADFGLFDKLAQLGQRLIDLHLLKSTELSPPLVRFQGRGDGTIEKIVYHEAQQRIYVNSQQYFEGISSEIWHYRIGGYQVCQKWLRERQEQAEFASNEFCLMATSLAITIEIQEAINEIYPLAEKTYIEFAH